MKNILVTGTSGKLGSFVRTHLTGQGYNVISIDRAPSSEPAGHSIVNLRDAGAVFDTILSLNERHSGLDAVVHLAAIPAPGLSSDREVIDNNFNSSLNVFMAATKAGVKKIVFASSETVLGLPFDEYPEYVPIDEKNELRPESYYSLSKVLEERMAAEMCRWDASLSMIALRFSNVIDPTEYEMFKSFQDDSFARKWNFWGYIDARDGALAVEKALQYSTPGFEPFIIASPDTVMMRENSILLDEVYPGIQKAREISPHETLLSIDKAKRLLGFNPTHSWRD